MKPYNKLTEEDKVSIIDAFYNKHVYGETTFKEVSNSIGVSERAFQRYLKEQGINTKRKNKYTLNESYFKQIVNEKQAYLLGLLYADGFVDEKTSYIALQLIDREPLELLKNELNYSGEIREVKSIGGYGDKIDTSKNSIVYRINFSSREMAYDLIDYGLFRSDVTNELPILEDDLMRHFIRGYFDGDGCFAIGKSSTYKRGKKYVYDNPIFNILCVDKFGENIIHLFNRVLGIDNMKTVKCKNTAYMVYIETRSRKNCRTIYNYLYSDATCFFKRKHDKWLQFIGDTCSATSCEKP